MNDGKSIRCLYDDTACIRYSHIHGAWVSGSRMNWMRRMLKRMGWA